MVFCLPYVDKTIPDTMKSFLLTLILTASVVVASTAQKTLQERRVHETYVEEITFTNKYHTVATVRTFTPTGERLTEEHYANYGEGIKHGLTRCWYPSGQVYWSSDFKHGETHGPLLVYYPDGSLKRREYFKYGISRKRECFDPTGEAQVCEAFAKPASYLGTEKDFLAQLKQQLEAVGYVPDKSTRYFSIKGYVLDNGLLTNVGESPSNLDFADKVRLAVMRIPRWQPATIDNKSISASYWLTLRLTGNKVYLSQEKRMMFK
jgi:hypothetical protein